MRKAIVTFLLLALGLSTARAEEPLSVVASFSVLADMTRQVGGERVEVTALVGPGSDIHAYSPSPTDARTLAEADLLVLNGLQLEGWIQRLIEASSYAGPRVIASQGIATLAAKAPLDEHDHGHEHGHHHDAGSADPHAWLDLERGAQYVINIRDALVDADPANAAVYRENARDYLVELETLNVKVRQWLAEIPEPQRIAITSHAAFGYFADAYDLRFLAATGTSSAAAPSAAAMAELIKLIRTREIPALFVESNTNPALVRQLAEETGVPIAGTLYAGALAQEGEASTYAGMMRHNAQLLREGLAR